MYRRLHMHNVQWKRKLGSFFFSVYNICCCYFNIITKLVRKMMMLFTHAKLHMLYPCPYVFTIRYLPTYTRMCQYLWKCHKPRQHNQSHLGFNLVLKSFCLNSFFFVFRFSVCFCVFFYSFRCFYVDIYIYFLAYVIVNLVL